MKSMLTMVLLFAAALAPARQANEAATFTPASPKSGEAITVTYDPAAPGATLGRTPPVECEMLAVIGGFGRSVYTATPMVEEGGRWTAKLTPDAGATLLLFRFAAGDSVDDHGGKVWNTMVVGNDGKPLPEAHYGMALLLRGGFRSFAYTRDMNGVRDHLRLEQELYPDRTAGIALRWDLMLSGDRSDGMKQTVLKEIAPIEGSPGIDERVLRLAIRALETAGDTVRAASLRSKAIAAFPKGSVARAAAWSAIMKEQDAPKRLASMEQFLADFPGGDEVERDRQIRTVVQTALLANNAGTAERYLPQISRPDGNFLNSIAWNQLEKEKDIDQAVAWAKEAVDLNRKADPLNRADFKTAKDWNASARYNTGMALDTYGYGLAKQKKMEEAEKAYAESYRLMEGDDAEATTRYIEAMNANKHFDEAIGVGLASIKKGKENDALLAAVKGSVVLKSGSGTGYETLASPEKKEFEARLAETRKARSEEVRKNVLASRVSKPSIDFTLKDLAGQPVTLSALKGKVVVVDFWATWCGPCRSSFPYLQKVVDRYKANDNVVILALDTWERKKDYATTVDNAKEFITKNKYTFRVLIDEGMVERYDVEGIPTKFVIDRSGAIAFSTVGFDGAGMEEELTQQIEVLLAEPGDTPPTK